MSSINPSAISRFQRSILRWHGSRRRDNLPWRITPDREVSPYGVFASEIMLQQTQVARVREKFPQFIFAFPDIRSLADSPLDRILGVWQGMGYNRRALYLKKSAKIIEDRFGGMIPRDPDVLKTLPGIGPYTAGAVACFAYNAPAVFLDTNIRKVFLHSFFPASRKSVPDKEILVLAKKTLWRRDPRRWNYALMDYGAMELSGKRGILERSRAYRRQSPFEDSTRYWRARVLRHLLSHPSMSAKELSCVLGHELSPVLSSLCRDGLIVQTVPGVYCISRT